MSQYVDAILKLKVPDALPLLAQFALETFGEGGNPESDHVEDFLGYVNTPVFGGYVNVRIGYAYGQALEYIEANGGNPYAVLVRIEWPELGPYEPVTYPVTLEDGTNIQQELGGFA